MTILITGGLGKTGVFVAEQLQAVAIPFILASCSGKVPWQYKAVKFDWNHPETFKNPFVADSHIDHVYLVISKVAQVPGMQPFVDLTRSKGVKHFVR